MGARALTKRQLARLSPRLGVLNNIPFAIPFDVRFNIFRNFVNNDADPHGSAPSSRSRAHWAPPTRITVRRGSIAQDGFNRLDGVDLKGPIAITFVDQWGQEEAGIDGGGVFKEFLTELCKEVFDTDRGLWLANAKRELYPNPHEYATECESFFVLGRKQRMLILVCFKRVVWRGTDSSDEYLARHYTRVSLLTLRLQVSSWRRCVTSLSATCEFFDSQDFVYSGLASRASWMT